jgi:hypothetical protein
MGKTNHSVYQIEANTDADYLLAFTAITMDYFT